MKIELTDGRIIEGTSRGYKPACIVFETAAGVEEIPFALIPAELQECFPHDPSVQAARGWREVQAAALKLKESSADFNARSLEMLDQVVRIAEELVREKAHLQSELKETRGWV